MNERDITNECYRCKHMRELNWTVHISCSNPDRNMVGSEHGKKNGWFSYPSKFDPVWKEKWCTNFEMKNE